MANNVLFKKGLQASLPSSGIVENAFYLTTDTHRLYAGVDNTHVALLNSAVAFYEKLADLQAATSQFKPAPGDVAYVRKQGELIVNALMLYVDDSIKWVQINSQNANTYYETTKIAFAKAEEETNDPSSITYTLTLEQKNQDGSARTPLTASFTINANDLHDTMSATGADSGKNALIKLDNATDKGVKLIAGDNVTLTTTENTGSADGITIAAKDTTYALGVVNGAATVQLSDGSGTSSGTAAFIGDNDWIDVTNDNGKIKVGHKSKTIPTPNVTDGGTLGDESTFTVITGITADDNNHVTGIQKTTYKIQDTTYTIDASLNNDKNLVVALKDENGTTTSSDSLDISSTLTVNGTDYTIEPSGEITLPSYYTTEQIDGKLKAVNAMVYKGVVNKNSDLPTTGVSIGWTYKVGTKATYAGIECNVGDLLIANGTEDNQNVITTGLTWDHIDTSDKEDTLYALSVANNVVTLTDSVNGGKQSFTIDGGNKLTASTSGNVITINHDSVTAPTTTGSTANVSGYGQDFSAITALTEDGYGHVTGITTKKVTLPNADTIEADGTNVKLTFKDGNGNIQGSLDLNAENGGPIAVTGTSSDNKNLVATISHNTITKNNTVSTQAPSHGGTFTAIESIEYDSYGHISGVKTSTVTLPTETTYEIDGPTAITNGFKYELKNGSGSVCGDVIKITSTSLTTTASGTIDITWGSF